jgi:hypothetical protein
MGSLLVFLCLLTGCTATSPGTAGAASGAAVSINKQIESFNATKRVEQGLVAIDRRVGRVSYDRLSDKVICYDTQGEQFLVLHRQRDGRYKGTLHVPYETWPRSDGSHSSGTMAVDFYLARGF